ncbi:GH25 family lysozyme [Streptomyces sp. NPDC026673]|uniref:GH25 family lysozyme n=1 Tax=Streptomyces sp. NPDC026673 TaxID=3155724 RepID=UPI0034032BAA
MTVKGIDVSSYQTATFATAGLDFVFVKATEGTSYVNPRMTAQAAHARAGGLVVGFYHFLRPGDMKRQAAYFVQQAASVEGDPLFADWEDPGVSCHDKDVFLAEVKRLRGNTHRVGLYCNQSYWTTRDTSSNAGDALWIADYVSAGHPRIKAAWKFHQYTDKPVDTNVGQFANRAALRAWARKAPATPPAAPHQPVKVDLSNLIRAFEDYPKHPASGSVKEVQRALHAEGLYSGALDGVAGPKTKAAYKAYQHRLGYSGKDADGIPGKTSATKLAKKRGFTLVA